MPLIGSVEARGLTTDQLSSRIADLLRQGYVRDPHVAVEVEAYRPFFILGEVTQPGQYPYVANMTVETAVAIAGGFTPRGYKKYVVISRNYGGQAYRFSTPDHRADPARRHHKGGGTLVLTTDGKRTQTTDDRRQKNSGTRHPSSVVRPPSSTI